ncbi:MAG TPA: F0F1 ATP synthase subunit B [Solirubrobacteraceae bacterium]|nr:F0F1 ATP synthase subunit B [Solirubrobacteraceae bacterium]
MAALATIPIAASGSFLITPNVGMTVWTLVVFAISLFILYKTVFPAIGRALDQRARTIAQSLDDAERTRREAEQLLAAYRERLAQAREQADEILARARRAAEAHERQTKEELRAQRERQLEQIRQEIQAETRRAIQEIRREVADLTVMATEKVTRRLLTEEDQRRLIEEALSELDFSALAAEGAERA